MQSEHQRRLRGGLDADTEAALRAYLDAHAAPFGTTEVREPPAGLNAYLAQAAGVTFSRLLLSLIRESGLGEVEVYKRAQVDRRLFSKIRSDPHYQPGKSTVIAFALALRLTVAQAQELLGSAGYTLSGGATSDLIIRFFLERGVYDLLRVNDALDAFGQPVLPV